MSTNEDNSEKLHPAVADAREKFMGLWKAAREIKCKNAGVGMELEKLDPKELGQADLLAMLQYFYANPLGFCCETDGEVRVEVLESSSLGLGNEIFSSRIYPIGGDYHSMLFFKSQGFPRLEMRKCATIDLVFPECFYGIYSGGELRKVFGEPRIEIYAPPTHEENWYDRHKEIGFTDPFPNRLLGRHLFSLDAAYDKFIFGDKTTRFVAAPRVFLCEGHLALKTLREMLEEE